MAQTLGELIREQRLARGLSLGQLASAVSRSPSSVRRWERGETTPADDQLMVVAGVLGLDPGELKDAVLAEAAEPAGEMEPAEAQVAAGDAEAGAESYEEPEPGDEPRPLVDEPGPLADDAEPDLDDDGPEPSQSTRDSMAEPEPESPTELVSAASGVSLASVSQPHPDPTTTDDSESAETTSETALDEPSPDPIPEDPAPVSGAPVVEVEEERPPRPVPLRYPESVPAGVAVEIAEPAPNLWNPLRYLYDPDKPWLYWVRAALTVIVLLILLNILFDSVSELFDKIGEVIDSIESTEPVDGEEVLP